MFISSLSVANNLAVACTLSLLLVCDVLGISAAAGLPSIANTLSNARVSATASSNCQALFQA